MLWLEKVEFFGLIYSVLKPREVFVKYGHKYKVLAESFSKVGTLLKASESLLLRPLFLFS